MSKILFLDSMILGMSLFASTLALAYEGSERGGGDLLPPEAGSAWFLGAEKSITYCISMGEQFGLPSSKVETLIFQSITKWKDYLQLKHIHSTLPKEQRLSVQFLLSGQCTGSENLTFYFGAETEHVKSIKSRFVNPVGFAYRTLFDLHTGFGKGFIWIASKNSVSNGFPNWANGNSLEAIILHELGHVFGCDHIEGTIMTEKIANVLESTEAARTHGVILNAIDGARELAISLSGDRGVIQGSFGNPNDKTSQETFFRFTGRKMGKDLHVQFQNGMIDGLPEIFLEDENGKFVIPFYYDKSGHSSVKTNLCAFRVANPASLSVENPAESCYYFRPAVVQGSVKDIYGQTHAAILEWDLDQQATVLLKYFIDGNWKVLFQSMGSTLLS